MVGPKGSIVQEVAGERQCKSAEMTARTGRGGGAEKNSDANKGHRSRVQRYVWFDGMAMVPGPIAWVALKKLESPYHGNESFPSSVRIISFKSIPQGLVSLAPPT
ncbi:hypothetical protein NL676_026525 [Syzygium grande]|nr:hypothetical protein NL676_026525 [Syzygium grande]